MTSPDARQANQLVALDTLCWRPWLLVTCTACGAPLPQVPVPRCRGCGHKSEPIEGTWLITDAPTGRALAVAWTACHRHVCRTDLAGLWQALEAKLRQRYGFEA